MKKDFLNISPESGGGSTQVTVTADPNPQMKERSTTLNFSSTGGGGLTKAVNAVQAGVPWVMLSGVQQGYGPNEDLNINPQEYLNDNGMLWIKATFSSSVITNQYFFVFFSNNENTFTLESIDSGTILKTFTKNGSIHFLKTDSVDEHNGFMSSLIVEMSKKGVYIKFNGIPIIKWAIN